MLSQTRLRFLPGVSGGIYRTLPAGREGRPALCECPVLCSGPSGLCGDVPRPPGSCRLSLTCLAGTCSWCHVVRVFPLRSLGERAHQPRLAVLFQARLSLARRGVVPPRSLLPLLPGGASVRGRLATSQLAVCGRERREVVPFPFVLRLLHGLSSLVAYHNFSRQPEFTCCK